MNKIAIFSFLFISYMVYSGFVYTKGTDNASSQPVGKRASVVRGKELFEQHNCSSCHQVYGLGGYLGPDLTTAWSDPKRGEAYIRALLMNGGNRMPRFGFHADEIESLVSYLQYIDSTAITYKTMR